MRVLMLGWEFPPYITGGLGTACYGLTKALDRRGVEVTFVLPKHVDESHAEHIDLVSPASLAAGGHGDLRATAAALAAGAEAVRVDAGWARSVAGGASSSPSSDPRFVRAWDELFRHVRFMPIPAGFCHPYVSSAGCDAGPQAAAGAPCHGAQGPGLVGLPPSLLHAALEWAVRTAIPEAEPSWGDLSCSRDGGDYSGDLIAEADRYARFVVAACAGLRFDVIHAHDWLTYPAGLALACVTGRPLVVHVHSTEFDRSGLHVNQRIYDIERRGMHGAIKVVAVSALTKNLCINRYGVTADKIEVVYNGVEITPQQVGMEDIQSRDKIVLYFGRITMQKGPEYFIYAAKRVLDVYKDVKFVVAGSGDQAQRMIELAASLGIGHKVLFTGFLRGKDIARVFSLADLYVMPSVSEPFGIAPLEALGHDVPVLISRTSGVSEVLAHALKCDFWDVDDIANKIVAVLRHPPLRRTLVEHGRFEVRRLTWDGAAERCEQVYRDCIAAMS